MVPDNFEGLTEQEKKLAMQMLEEFSKTGDSKTFEEIKYQDYEEIPVDIETFLHDRRYLGNGLYDSSGRFTIYPYWEKTLKDIFPDNITTKYNTLILTGAIGLGKTQIACVCLLYILYRLLCLKDPYLFYGLQPIDKISISLMNITLENAKGVALDKINQMILSSEWFMSHGEMRGTTNLEYVPEKHIELITASSNNQVVGRCLLANFTDEINFGLTNDVEKLKKKQKQLISQIDARMKSRFLRGNYLPTLNILASSKNSDQSFLEGYINDKRKNESKTTLIVDEPQWIVDTRKVTDKWFYVAVGNKFLASELLPKDAPEGLVEEYRAKGYSMLKVPEAYYEGFQENLDGALADIAGIAAASGLKYISGMRWNEIKSDTYENPFTKEIIEVGTNDNLQYSDFFDITKVPEELKRKPLYIHLDMSQGSGGKGDKTGICGVYVLGKRPKIEGESSSKELYYQVAFGVSIKAPKSSEISFDKNRMFIRWLREQNFNVKSVTCFKGDTLISTPMGLKKIKDISIGEIVYAFDDSVHQIVESKVYNVINNGLKTDFIRVWISDNDYIECTPEHQIKTQRGYIMAKDLRDDDMIEVDSGLFYKQKLLQTGLFIDNEYLAEYTELITDYQCAPNSYTERHHIIPRCIFNYLHKEIDNSDTNMVSLKYADHIKAHYLLSKCCTSEILYPMSGAVTRMLNHKNLVQNDIEEFLKDTVLQAAIEEMKLTHNKLLSEKMKGNQLTRGRQHTEEEKKKISESNKKPHGVHPKSEFKKGDVPWNSGISYKQLYSEEERKSIFSKNGEYIWISNGKDEYQILKTDTIPEGFMPNKRLGCSKEAKAKISETHKRLGKKPPAQSGFSYYTDGTLTIRIFPGDSIPEGFWKGRTMDTSVRRSTGFIYSAQFKSLNPEEYKNYYLLHSTKETMEFFNISRANHRTFCKFYNIKKDK